MDRDCPYNTTTPLAQGVLDLPPSCIEFAPWNVPARGGISRSRGQHFIVGTYNLQLEQTSSAVEPGDNASSRSQSRNGSLNLCRLDDEDGLKLVQKVPYPSAVLDLHFLPGDPSIFAVSSSTGCISIFAFKPKFVNHRLVCTRHSKSCQAYECDREHYIEETVTHQIFSRDTIVTSFAWYPYGATDERYCPLIAATLSTGEIHLVQFPNRDFSKFEIINDGDPINVHGLEAWCCSFSSSRYRTAGDCGNTIYSGGDDAALRRVCLETVPLRHGDKIEIIPEEDGLSPDVSDRPWKLGGAAAGRFSGHTAGVTAVLPLPIYTADMAEMLLTGSYDDYVRVYTTVDFRPYAPDTGPKILTELYIGGGVWRLKFLQDYEAMGSIDQCKDISFRVLASCMHAGALVLQVTGNQFGEWEIEILGDIYQHKSMCYASDVQPQDPEILKDKSKKRGWDETRICVSTSFYDRLICLWKFNPTNNRLLPGRTVQGVVDKSWREVPFLLLSEDSLAKEDHDIKDEDNQIKDEDHDIKAEDNNVKEENRGIKEESVEVKDEDSSS